MQAKAKIMVVRDIERDDIEYISKTLNCLPIAHADHMKPEKLGHADRVDEVQVSRWSIMSKVSFGDLPTCNIPAVIQTEDTLLHGYCLYCLDSSQLISYSLYLATPLSHSAACECLC